MRALGAGTVSASEIPDFAIGERVCGLLGWQEDAVVDGAIQRRVPDGVLVDASPTLDALLPHVAVNARVVLCGAISRDEGGRGPAPLHNWFYLLPNRA